MTRLDRKKQPKRRRLMVEIVIWIIAVFVIFIAIARIVWTHILSRNMYDYIDIHLTDSAVYTSSILYEYGESLPWLVSYWVDHAEEMVIPRNAFSKDNSKWSDVHKWYNKKYGRPLSVDELQELSAQEQKQYAELCYLLIAHRFDMLVNNYTGMCFVCSKKDEVSKYDTLLFLGMDKNTGDRYQLGTRFKVELQDDRISTVSIDDKDSDGKGSSYYMVHIPIYDEGNNEIATVSVGYDWSIVEDVLNRNILFQYVILLLSLVVFCIVIILLLKYKFIKPLETVSGAVRDYIKTKQSSKVAKDLDSMIGAPKKTEIEELAADLFDLSLEIDNYTREIKINAAEKEKKRVEMDMAATIQRSQLPSISDEFDTMEAFDIFAAMTPAKEVGGDFYDFFKIDEDHLALVIADVTDKGVPAALFMMTSKSLIRSELKGVSGLCEAFAHVNQQLNATNGAKMYVTVWGAVVELSTGIIKSVNAGHEQPVLRRVGESWKMINSVHDLPLACMPQFEFVENESILKSGDIILVYTDGVLDASNPEGERFGKKRVLEVLNRCDKEKPEEIIHEMSDSIAGFVKGAESKDDITMLCFKIK